MVNDFELSELLTVKICHDLSGPIGAINNGVELLKEGSDEIHSQSIDLVEASAREAVSRLLFYRQTYGSSYSQSDVVLSQVKKVSEDYLLWKKITLDWPLDIKCADSVHTIKGQQSKLLLNIILLVSTTLIMGGNISIKITKKGKDTSLFIKGEGERVRAEKEILSIITDKTEPSNITVKNVQPYIIRRIAQNISTQISVNNSDNFIEIRAE